MDTNKGNGRKGIYRLLPAKTEKKKIYTGPERKDLVLTLDSKDGVVNKLLQAEQEPVYKQLTVKRRESPLRDLRVIQSCIIYAAFFVQGVCMVLPGTSLLDLQLLTGSKLSTISMLFTVRAVAAVFGAVLASFLIERLNKWILLGLSVALVAVTNALLPFCQQASVMIAVVGLCGVGLGFYDAGGNLSLISVWGKKHGPWMQALHCAYAVGSFAAPWIIDPFLTHESDIKTSVLYPTTTDPLDKYLFIIDTNTTTTDPLDKYLFLIDTNTTSSTEKMTTVQFVSNAYSEQNLSVDIGSASRHVDIKIHYAYVFSSILALIIAIMFIIMGVFVYLKQKKAAKKTIGSAEEDDNDDIEADDKESIDQPIWFVIILTSMVCCFFLIYCIIELNYSHYLMTYAVKGLGWTKRSGTTATSIYWGLFFLGRLLGIYVVTVLRPSVYLGLSVAFMAIASLPLLMISITDSMLWVTSVGLGFSAAAVFATGITWTSGYMKLSGIVGAVFMIGGAGGEMLGPILMTTCFEYFGVEAYTYVIVVASCFLLVVFITMQLFASKFGKKDEDREYRNTGIDIKHKLDTE